MRQVEFGSIDEVLEEPAIKWLIPAWLPDREVTMLWGREGTYKSFIALHWSLTLAAAKHPVVYIAAEGLSGLRARVLAWMTHHNSGPRELQQWHYFNSNIYLNQTHQRKAWIEALRHYLNPNWRSGSNDPRVTPDLIIVDTLDRCYDGEENSSKEMGHLIDGCEELRRAFDSAVLLVHHSRKEGDRERGTTSLPAAVFASHYVSKPTVRPSSGGGTVSVKCMKMKDAEEPEPVKVELKQVEFTDDITPDFDEVIDSSLVVGRWGAPKVKRAKR